MRVTIKVFIIGYIVFFWSASCKKRAAKNETTDETKIQSKDSCTYILIRNGVLKEFIDGFSFNDFNSVSAASDKVEISKQPITNSFDSTKIDTVTIIKSPSSLYRYYIGSNYKIALEARIFTKGMSVGNGIKIGMASNDFKEKVAKKFFEGDIGGDSDCIHATILSEYVHFYFFFSDSKLQRIDYIDTAESFR